MRVLIVDDSRVCRMLYRREIEEAGFDTVEAADGVEALELIKMTEVDLVVLDIEMPNMNGFEVCERLRSEEFTTRFHKKDQILPVIFVTSDKTKNSRIEGFSKGANEFINKGFKPGTLAHLVEDLLKPTDPLLGIKAIVSEKSRFPRKMIGGLLEARGADVLYCETGKEAFDHVFAEGQDIKIVITAQSLSDTTGLKLCKRIRKDLGYKSLPVIVIMDAYDRRLLQDLFEAGITDYLVKPFDKSELLARIQVALETISSLEIEIQDRMEKEAEVKATLELAEAHAKVAGAAELATTIIHNIGNVLNSVYVSCFQASSQMKTSRLPQLLMAHQLIIDNQERLGEFFEQDPKGKLLPSYLEQCGKKIEQEHLAIAREIEDINTKIHLMKDIVQAQQSHAKDTGDTISVKLEELVKDALTIQKGSIKKYEIELVESYAQESLISIPKTQITHIIINLIKNAIEAMRNIDSGILKITVKEDETMVKLMISDNGSGIEPEDLNRVFTYGFTTKEDGHGFGLAFCSRIADELGGQLKAESKGTGQGATFTLELPRDS